MAGIKDLKKRISTVKNTQQTTRAMKMVSAAKLRRAQESIQNQRPYAKRIDQLIRKMLVGVDPEKLPASVFGDASARVIKSLSEVAEQKGRKKVLLLVVSSDRGLCGGFNSSVIKTAQRWVMSHSDCDVRFAFVGRKGYEYFKRREVPIQGYFEEIGGKVTFLKARELSQQLLDLYNRGEIDEVKFVYNEFKNAVTQRVLVEDFLPLVPEQALSSIQEGGDGETEDSNSSSTGETDTDALDLALVKPSREVVLSQLFGKHFSMQAFRVLLESQAGEHGARMSAMENATKNAGEMIRKLTLQYNKQRQAGITKELLEIIAGSESQKG